MFFFCRTFHYLHFCHLGKARAVIDWWQLLFKNRRFHFHFSSRFCYDEEAQCRNIYFHFLYLTLEIGSILWSRWNKMWKKKKRSESFGVNCYILRKINIHVAQVWQLFIERHSLDFKTNGSLSRGSKFIILSNKKTEMLSHRWLHEISSFETKLFVQESWLIRE